MADPRIVLFTRFPVPGTAKTRLIPATGPKVAADIHRRLTERTVAILRETGLPMEIRVTGAPKGDFALWLGEDLAYAEQGDGDLGTRMRRAAKPCPVIFIGSDCPDLAVGHLLDAARAIEETNLVVGPAEDGGYWLLGLRKPFGWLFEDITWGTSQVLPETLERAALHDIGPHLLETLSDCDRPADLERWPWLLE